MSEVPRGTTDADEAALILRGHEERITRLEEDRDNVRLVQTFRTYSDSFGLDDALTLSAGADVALADAFGLDDSLSLSAKNVGTAVYRDSNEPYRFTTYGRTDFSDDQFGEAGFGEDGFGGDGFGEDDFGEDGFGEDGFGE